MSIYADSAEAVLWVDGDAFRGAANLTAPTDPFAAAPASLEAYGAVKAGFTITPSQDKKTFDVWNNESGAAFFEFDGQTTQTIKFRVSQMSKAAVLTELKGGSIAETAGGSGIWKWTKGSGEEFSLLLQLKSSDSLKKMAYWAPRAKLAAEPELVKNDEDLDGWEFEITILAPSGGGQALTPYSNWNPLA
ncbi:hypothetical protein N8J89_08115 [Crossiella sp. CA-258035]|uniref:hypothetical protein n=1 Tax=Crossiella sp. CA-258035 TaxID=2981138 RepID=UPI0024BC75E7|nr:hypothetical protein [Crossiella sp. CA-258035]WHT21020.1 hypothetical protein N8J89_08115 [Crossiella sp. CA-258035]